MKGPVIIEETNLSIAWARAFLEVYETEEVAPLVVVVNDLANGDVAEVPAIRTTLDQLLEAQDETSCHTLANTIFPSEMWNKNAKREELFDRYLMLLPILRRLHSGNKYGLYFERLIAFGCDNKGKGGVNQLEHILSTWKRGNRRRTALQASLFDPRKDHTHQRQRGFPCLQHVSFARTNRNGLAVTGTYVTQHVVEKAYGNFLGLCRLGRFMAHEMGLRLDRMTCIANPGRRDRPKSELHTLAETIRVLLEQFPLEGGYDSGA